MDEPFEYRELENLLDQERDVLLAGRIDDLKKILETKEELISKLTASKIEKLAGIEEISKKLKRNQVLFDGALDGIRSVMNNIAERKKCSLSMSTYSASGRRQTTRNRPSVRLEKRS